MPTFPHLYYKNQNTIIDANGQEYTMVKSLEGRGQAGLGAFYTSNTEGKQVLLKNDDPATCVLEGSASFVVTSGAIPKQLANTANYAHVGLYTNQDQEVTIISIQDRVAPIDNANTQVIPWDIIVYGRKREPKTMFSEESWHAKEIQQHLTNMSPATQWQLAGGIFSSSVAGDESIHIGQFMAIQDQEKNLVAIKRIDFGARERYAVARSENKYNPYNTSSQYSSSGQYGKDYIDFLLSAQDIKRKYMLLWALAITDKIEAAYSDTFNRAIIFLPEELQQSAYHNILTSINKKAQQKFNSKKIPLIEKIDELSTYLGKLATNRADAIKMVALKDLQEVFDKANESELMQHFIDAYNNDNFEQINNLIKRLENKEIQSIANINLILYICDTGLLMSIANVYQDKQTFYLYKLQEYQIKLGTLEFVERLSLPKEIINNNVIKDLVKIIIDKHNYKYHTEQLKDASIWNELFNHGLQTKNVGIIDLVLGQNLDFTAFGNKDAATNHNNDKRPEGALLLAAKANDYKTVSKLLIKRAKQYLATSNAASQVNKTIGSIDRKDENSENIFHHLFKNWNTISEEVNKSALLKNLLELLIIEAPVLGSKSRTIPAVFSQINAHGKTPLHMIIENNNIEAFTTLWMAIKATNYRLMDFIDFEQEGTFEKNFLDYAYGAQNTEIFQDLIEVIRDARLQKYISGDARNKFLCSNSSPLSQEEKQMVETKSSKTSFIPPLFMQPKSGKDNFEYGVKLWLEKMPQKPTSTYTR